AAFAVKAPLFPLHAWLPEAYRESSPEVAAVLSGVVSKAAAYGFLRIAITKFPGPTSDFRIPILVLAGCGLIYGSLLAFRAPVLMTAGISALAVRGSTAFAGEFAILSGVFFTGWGWAVVGAVAIVLAAMYMLRLISAVLHVRPGPSVTEAALDLRPAELGI